MGWDVQGPAPHRRKDTRCGGRKDQSHTGAGPYRDREGRTSVTIVSIISEKQKLRSSFETEGMKHWVWRDREVWAVRGRRGAVAGGCPSAAASGHWGDKQSRRRAAETSVGSQRCWCRCSLGKASYRFSTRLRWPLLLCLPGTRSIPTAPHHHHTGGQGRVPEWPREGCGGSSAGTKEPL